MKGEGRYFLVKWLEYSNSDNQWLNIDRLNCTDLLEEYLLKKGNDEKKTNVKFNDKVEQRRFNNRQK